MWMGDINMFIQEYWDNQSEVQSVDGIDADCCQETRVLGQDSSQPPLKHSMKFPEGNPWCPRVSAAIFSCSGTALKMGMPGRDGNPLGSISDSGAVDRSSDLGCSCVLLGLKTVNGVIVLKISGLNVLISNPIKKFISSAVAFLGSKASSECTGCMGVKFGKAYA